MVANWMQAYWLKLMSYRNCVELVGYALPNNSFYRLFGSFPISHFTYKVHLL